MISLLSYPYSDLNVIRLYEKDKQWYDIPIAVYNQKFKTQLTHAIMYRRQDSDIVQQILDKLKIYESTKLEDSDSVKTFITSPVNYFNICYLNAFCGFGLIANKYIPDNT